MKRVFVILLFFAPLLNAQNPTGTGTANYIAKWNSSTNLTTSALCQSATGGLVGIATCAPTQRLQVNSGNVLVRGLNNFTAFGQFANYYVGDTNHATGAAHGAGLYFSTYHVPYAMTIQDQTGYVGIGFASTPSIPTEHNGVLTVAGHNTDNLLYMRSGAGTFVVDGAGNLFLLETSGAGGNIVADGSIHASGQLDTGSGVKFPDGTVQTTAYKPAAATAIQASTTQQLVELVQQLQARVKRLEAAGK